jgi:inositol hexakisphosphate/diphosphoinositol-pentakisphosphate kinase
VSAEADLLLEINLPEKEELLWKDEELDFREYEDFLMINGVKLSKPFVEKPINAEDHEI